MAAEIAEGAETPTNVVAEIAEGVEITINVVAEIAEGAEITIKVAVEDVEDRNKCHTVKDRRAMRQATYEVAVRLLYHVASICKFYPSSHFNDAMPSLLHRNI